MLTTNCSFIASFSLMTRIAVETSSLVIGGEGAEPDPSLIAIARWGRLAFGVLPDGCVPCDGVEVAGGDALGVNPMAPPKFGPGIGRAAMPCMLNVDMARKRWQPVRIAYRRSY